MLQSIRLQRVGHNLTTEQQQQQVPLFFLLCTPLFLNFQQVEMMGTSLFCSRWGYTIQFSLFESSFWGLFVIAAQPTHEGTQTRLGKKLISTTAVCLFAKTCWMTDINVALHCSVILQGQFFIAKENSYHKLGQCKLIILSLLHWVHLYLLRKSCFPVNCQSGLFIQLV